MEEKQEKVRRKVYRKKMEKYPHSRQVGSSIFKYNCVHIFKLNFHVFRRKYPHVRLLITIQKLLRHFL